MGTKQTRPKETGRSITETNPWRSATFTFPDSFVRQDIYEMLHSLSLSHLLKRCREVAKVTSRETLTEQLSTDLRELLQCVYDEHPDKFVALHKMLQHKGVCVRNVDSAALQVYNDNVHSSSPRSGRRNAKDAKVFDNKNATTILVKLDEDHRPEDAYVYVDVGQKEKPAKRHSCPLEQLETTLETDHRGFLQSDGAIQTSQLQDVSNNLFLHASRDSEVRVESCNIIVMGQTGAGKTSSICNLIQQPLPVDPTSTELAEISPNFFSQSKESFKFEPVLPEDHVDVLSQSILPQVLEANGQTSLISSCGLSGRRNSSSSSLPPTETVPSQLIESVRERVSYKAAKASLRTEVHLEMKPGELPTLSLCQFIDCGGLPFFRNLLPQFFPSSNAIFLLVHNLMDKLLDKAQVKVLDNGKLVHSRRLPVSNIQEILNWIHIIHSCCQTGGAQGSASSSSHNALLVGTHFDQLLRACHDNRDLATEAAQMATEFICHHVVGQPCGRILDPEPVFLDNTLSGTDTCPSVEHLRRKLLSLAPTAVNIPSLWAALVLHLKEVCKERNQASIVTLEDFLDIAKAKFALKAEEAEKALDKFQEMCLVFRMPGPSCLNRVIFTDLQWLFNALASILNPLESYSEQGRFYQGWWDMKTKGFMSENLYSHIFSKSPRNALLPRLWVSDFLESLHLLAKVPSAHGGTRCFCPILLPPFGSLKSEDDPFRPQTQIEPLYLRPVSGSIPPGFLARLFTILSRRPDLSQVACCSQLSATFEFCIGGGSSASKHFFVRISEEQDAVKLEFCNAYTDTIDNSRACDVATSIVAMVMEASRSVKKVWTHSPDMVTELERPVTPQKSRSRAKARPKKMLVPCLFLDCRDPDCMTTPGDHLAKVHPLPLNRERPYVQCTLNQRRQYIGDLFPSQLIWLRDVVEDEGEKELMLESLFFVIIDEEDTCQVQQEQASSGSTFPLSHNTEKRKGLFMSDKKKLDRRWVSFTARRKRSIKKKHTKQVASSSGRQRSVSTVEPSCMLDSTASVCLPSETLSILDRHFEIFNRNLNLDLRYHLFQMGILIDDELEAIGEEAEGGSGDFLMSASPQLTQVPNPRRRAVRRILDAARRGSEHGLMGLVVCLENNCDKKNPIKCGHRAILNELKQDSDFAGIKERWLSSLTIGNAPCPAREHSPSCRSPS